MKNDAGDIDTLIIIFLGMQLVGMLVVFGYSLYAEYANPCVRYVAEECIPYNHKVCVERKFYNEFIRTRKDRIGN